MRRLLLFLAGTTTLGFTGLLRACAPSVHSQSLSNRELPVMGAVEWLLRPGARLPAPGTGLAHRPGALEWEGAPMADGPLITTTTIENVRAFSHESLLWTLLDDDPTYVVELAVLVGTADGKQTRLRLLFWDYGRVTPWGLRVLGDGLKPRRVEWNAPGGPTWTRWS